MALVGRRSHRPLGPDRQRGPRPVPGSRTSLDRNPGREGRAAQARTRPAEPFREQAEAAATSIVVDPRQRGSNQVKHRPPRLLDEIQEAVIRGVQVRLGYVDREGSETERTVHPLGIVAKGPTWYLVSNTDAGRRTFRIDRVSSVQLTDDLAQRPEGFDLAASWREIADESTESAHRSRPRPCALPTGSACSGWSSEAASKLVVPRSTAGSTS